MVTPQHAQVENCIDVYMYIYDDDDDDGDFKSCNPHGPIICPYIHQLNLTDD